MTKSRKIMIITVLAGISVLLYVTASYSGLTASYRGIIRVAYMNGFMEAVKMDPEALNRIRLESALLQESVEEAAERYVRKVDDLNNNKSGLKESYKSLPF